MGTMYTAMLFTILLGLLLDANALTQTEIEEKITRLEQQLEFGGKKYETVQYISKLQL